MHEPKIHLKKTLHQEPRVKDENLFLGETLISGKMHTFSENLGYFRAKKLSTQIPT